nr:unnamed protein product [Callosobruchus analis]
MQPANVEAFRPLKNGWNKAVLNFRRENPNSIVTKENFALVLNKAISMQLVYILETHQRLIIPNVRESIPIKMKIVAFLKNL